MCVHEVHLDGAGEGAFSCGAHVAPTDLTYGTRFHFVFACGSGSSQCTFLQFCDSISMMNGVDKLTEIRYSLRGITTLYRTKFS